MKRHARIGFGSLDFVCLSDMYRNTGTNYRNIPRNLQVAPENQSKDEQEKEGGIRHPYFVEDDCTRGQSCYNVGVP